MPIRFRCRHCRQFLGISRARAGTITDCPTCGKSIRVPNLDGSIDPIPTPELNLQDEELVEALGELARLSNSGASDGLAEVAPPRFERKHDATVIAPKAEAVAMPEAEPASPLSPGESETVTQAQEAIGTAIEREEAMRALAESSPIRSGASFRSRQSRKERKRVWIVSGLTAAAAICLLAVIWVSGGRKSPPLSVDAAADERRADHQAEPPLRVPLDVPDSAIEELTTLTGRASYITAGGESRPDAGARVLLLPKIKPGRVKLDVTGFLAGADAVDTRVARAALHALGGDLAETDNDGRFSLNLTRDGDYHLLAISRHLPRESLDTVDPRLLDALSAYFFRPASLLGQLAFRWDEVHFDGQELSPRNITFAAE